MRFGVDPVWLSEDLRELDAAVSAAGEELIATMKRAANNPRGREMIRAALRRVDDAMDRYYAYREGRKP